LWVDCIRVTHPYATLAPLLLTELPFSLHVLGLPLAFILSQDQTLHSINPSCLNTSSSRSQHQTHYSILWLHWSSESLHSHGATLKESTRSYPLSSISGSAINLIVFKERLTPATGFYPRFRVIATSKEIWLHSPFLRSRKALLQMGVQR